MGLDSAILMNPQVWVASGHVGGFSDPLMDCKNCRSRFRADQLAEEYAKEHGLSISPDGMSSQELEAFISQNQVPCPVCGKSDFTSIRKFNLMFRTHMGVTEDSTSEVYLRPETAQGIFVNFKNVLRTSRKSCPSASPRSAKASATRLPPATSSSGSGSSSRWSWSSSACPVKT